MTDFSLDVLRAELAAGPGEPGQQRYCVAFSGGLDSSVLLAAMVRVGASAAPGTLRALHVNHGLHGASPAWARHCSARCDELGVPLEVLLVDARARRGESPEARARELRYAALREALAPGETLLTAHHADDQLETVLIQLLRGAGVAGLAAMPPIAAFGRGHHQRPLLACSRASLLAWARSCGLEGWLEDPANEELRFSRNHLRSEVLPAIRAHWPGAAAAVGRAARHCAEAAGLLDALGAIDAADAADVAEAANFPPGNTLRVSALVRLSAARQRNLVRWQCRAVGLPVPDERRLATLLEQLSGAAGDTLPEVRWEGVIAWRYADRLWLVAEEALPPAGEQLDWPDPRRPLALGPGLGSLSLVPTEAGGLRREALEAAPWRVRFRSGGERLRLPGRAGSRSLKKLLQAAGVPPWLRARIPLLEVGGQLAAVGGLWIDEAWWAPPGTGALRLCWVGCTLPGQETFVVDRQAF